MTVELLAPQIELVDKRETGTVQSPVSALVIAEHASQLDNVVERLAALGNLSLSECRRTAFAIIGEDIAEPETREILRTLYVPEAATPVVASRSNALDSLKGRSI